MIILENTTDFSIDLDRLEAIADTQTQRDVELILCDDAAIAELNRTHRGIDDPTDVLSFPLEGELDHLPLGTIVISLDHIRRKANELGHTPDEEAALLFVHGLLHLLGYDHESDAGEMREYEHALLRRFDLPESLIVRTEAS
jgi:probable rRNA maturation factor